MKNQLLSTVSRDTLGWRMEIDGRVRRKEQALKILEKFETRQTEIDRRAQVMNSLTAAQRKQLRKAAEVEGISLNHLSADRIEALVREGG